MQDRNKIILRIGLAFVLFYAGISAFIHPYDWIGFVPTWANRFGMSQIIALHLHSVVEIILGLWLIIGKKLRLAAVLTAIDIGTILLISGFDRTVFLATFRDVGLVAMAIYLAL